MKEQIYTIPVNESFEQDCECPLCYLTEKLEREAIDYVLGAAMMEPDFRIVSNEKGYCTLHYNMMIHKSNKLSLALILDTHLQEIEKKFTSLQKDIKNLKNEKKGLFKKDGKVSLSSINEALKKSSCDCVVCDKIKNTTDRYITVFFHLWKNDTAFREKVLSSKGVCLPHFEELVNKAFEELSHTAACEFIEILYEKEKKELERLQADIHKFTLKFDYRNKDMVLGNAETAPLNTIEKLSGYLCDISPDNK